MSFTVVNVFVRCTLEREGEGGRERGKGEKGRERERGREREITTGVWSTFGLPSAYMPTTHSVTWGVECWGTKIEILQGRLKSLTKSVSVWSILWRTLGYFRHSACVHTLQAIVLTRYSFHCGYFAWASCQQRQHPPSNFRRKERNRNSSVGGYEPSCRQGMMDMHWEKRGWKTTNSVLSKLHLHSPEYVTSTTATTTTNTTTNNNDNDDDDDGYIDNDDDDNVNRHHHHMLIA